MSLFMLLIQTSKFYNCCNFWNSIFNRKKFKKENIQNLVLSFFYCFERTRYFYVSSSQIVSVSIAMLSRPCIGAYSRVHIKFVNITVKATTTIIISQFLQKNLKNKRDTHAFHPDTNLLSARDKSCCTDWLASISGVWRLEVAQGRSVPSPTRPSCSSGCCSPRTWAPSWSAPVRRYWTRSTDAGSTYAAP